MHEPVSCLKVAQTCLQLFRSKNAKKKSARKSVAAFASLFPAVFGLLSGFSFWQYIISFVQMSVRANKILDFIIFDVLMVG